MSNALKHLEDPSLAGDSLAVGYSTVEYDGGALVLVPHVGAAVAARLDPQARRLDLDVGGQCLELHDLPDAVVELMISAPRKVTIASTDALSKLRFGALLSELLPKDELGATA